MVAVAEAAIDLTRVAVKGAWVATRLASSGAVALAKWGISDRSSDDSVSLQSHFEKQITWLTQRPLYATVHPESDDGDEDESDDESQHEDVTHETAAGDIEIEEEPDGTQDVADADNPALWKRLLSSIGDYLKEQKEALLDSGWERDFIKNLVEDGVTTIEQAVDPDYLKKRLVSLPNDVLVALVQSTKFLSNAEFAILLVASTEDYLEKSEKGLAVVKESDLPLLYIAAINIVIGTAKQASHTSNVTEMLEAFIASLYFLIYLSIEKSLLSIDLAFKIGVSTGAILGAANFVNVDDSGITITPRAMMHKPVAVLKDGEGSTHSIAVNIPPAVVAAARAIQLPKSGAINLTTWIRLGLAFNVAPDVNIIFLNIGIVSAVLSTLARLIETSLVTPTDEVRSAQSMAYRLTKLESQIAAGNLIIIQGFYVLQREIKRFGGIVVDPAEGNPATAIKFSLYIPLALLFIVTFKDAERMNLRLLGKLMSQVKRSIDKIEPVESTQAALEKFKQLRLNPDLPQHHGFWAKLTKTGTVELVDQVRATGATYFGLNNGGKGK